MAGFVNSILFTFAAPAAFSVNKTSAVLSEGQNLTLNASVSPAKATVKKITYETSKKSVATVTKKGVVTAKKAGTAKITAFAQDGLKSLQDQLSYLDSCISYYKELVSLYDSFSGEKLKKILTDLSYFLASLAERFLPLSNFCCNLYHASHVFIYSVIFIHEIS